MESSGRLMLSTSAIYDRIRAALNVVVVPKLLLMLSALASSQIWFGILGFSFSAPPDDSVLCDWLLACLSDFDRATCRLFVIALWKLWWFRNSRLHSGSPLASPVKCHQIRSFHALIEAAPAPPPKPLSGSQSSSFSSVSDPIIIFFDGSFLPIDCRGAGGGIAIDSSGIPLASFAVPFPSASSPLMAEALACRFAISFARFLGFPAITFKGDNLSIISKMSSPAPDRSLVASVISDAKHLLSSFVSSNFLFVRRSDKSDADALAKFGLNPSESHIWVEGVLIGHLIA